MLRPQSSSNGGTGNGAMPAITEDYPTRYRRLRPVPAPTDVRTTSPEPPGESVKIDYPTGWGPSNTFVWQFAQSADEFPAWGYPYSRDLKLREFWPTEPMFAGALFTKISQYTSLRWSIDGPTSHRDQTVEMLNGVENGKGWAHMMLKVCIDLFTQDNGAFIEIVRARPDDPTAPVLTLNHLDALRCIRTGNNLNPVQYTDIKGKRHLLKWFQVMPLAEMPSPDERWRGMQYCVLTRLLTAAQIMKSIQVYHKEKVSGQFKGSIHFIGGVARAVVEDVLKTHDLKQEEMGRLRYSSPVLVTALDPSTTISTATIDLAALPEGFDLEKWMTYYINQFALAWGADYQDFAPLASGTRGGSGSSQANILHMKSRGKGAALFVSMIEQAFNYHGIMPRTCEFKYGEQDEMADLELAEVRKARAQERQVRVMSGEINPEQARELAFAEGDLTEEQYNKFQADPKSPQEMPQTTPFGGPGNGDNSPAKGGAPVSNSSGHSVSPSGGHPTPASGLAKARAASSSGSKEVGT